MHFMAKDLSKNNEKGQDCVMILKNKGLENRMQNTQQRNYRVSLDKKILDNKRLLIKRQTSDTTSDNEWYNQ